MPRLAFLLATLIAVASPSLQPTEPPGAEPTEVAPGVFVFAPGHTFDDFVDGNTTVVFGKSAVLVVDAPSVRLARAHAHWIRSHTALPVRYLVNTHWHPDHLGGNQVYSDSFPGVEIVATRYTRQIADERIPAVLVGLRGPRIDTLIGNYRRSIDSAATDAHKAASFETQRARDALAYIARERPFWLETRYTPASLAFDGELRLDLGGREVVIREAEGHTGGDAYVHLPREGVLVTGDLVIAPVPYGINSHFRAWSRTLASLQAIGGIRTIVPGHGDVLRSWDYVRTQQELIDSLLAQVAAGVRVRLPVDSIQRHVDLSRFERQMAGDDAARRWGFENYFREPAVERAFQEVRGEL
jgi:glyoxylase-like metal-dependent hydrolase (beta-lactamase superfamily II)